MNKQPYIKIIFALLILGIVSISCEKKAEETAVAESTAIQLTAEQKQNAGITFGQLEERELPQEVSCNGLVDVPPVSAASVSVPINGYIKSTSELLPGKKVAKGEVLATIASLEYIQMQQDYLQASSQLGLLTSEKSRQQVLSNEEVGSKKKLQQAEADLGNLQAQQKGLALKLDLLGCDLKALTAGNINSILKVKSPIDGYIQNVNISIGKYITSSDVIATIVGVNHKHVELKVFEKDLMKLKIGQRIQIEAEGNSSTGKVFLIGKQVDLETRTTSVHGHFSSDAEEQKFTIGQFVNAKILVNNVKMLTIPQGGFARVGKGGFIYVETPKGQMAQVPVEVLGSNTDFVGIRALKAIPEGKVVLSGASALEAIFAKD
ncbi:efflux RND transporter periplasmic adaptor subunit [Aquirufa sp. ROCK2-A2]